MNHTILILQRAFCEDELAACDNKTLSLIQIGCDDDIGDAGFVLHRQKDKSHRCTWPLPCDDTTCGSNKFTMFTIFAILPRKERVPAVVVQGGYMPWDVCQLSARCRHSLQLNVPRCSSVAVALRSETSRSSSLLWRKRGPPSFPALFDLPESIAAMLDIAQRIQSADARQEYQFLSVERGNANGEILHRQEWTVLPAENASCLGRWLPQAFCIAQAEYAAESAVRFVLDSAQPI